MQTTTDDQEIAVVNIRINGISRHKQQVYKKGLSKVEIKALKDRMKAFLYDEWKDVHVHCTALSKKLPQTFKNYHKAQEDAYGYIKYRVERDESVQGKVFYSVHAMSKYGGYLRCRLNYVEEKEVTKFIEQNPVGE